jgi:ornithine cyclodeaminase
MPGEFLYPSQEDVIAAGGLDIDGTLAAVEKVFRLRGQKDVVKRLKSPIRWGPVVPDYS